jgi:hypothetical protein
VLVFRGVDVFAEFIGGGPEDLFEGFGGGGVSFFALGMMYTGVKMESYKLFTTTIVIK